MAAIVRTCRECGDEFAITDHEQEDFARLSRAQPAGRDGNGWMLPARCAACRLERRRAIASRRDLTRTCQTCAQAFVISARDQVHFERLRKQLPIDCGPCREYARLEAAQP